jgi:hypothetical protein
MSGGKRASENKIHTVLEDYCGDKIENMKLHIPYAM